MIGTRSMPTRFGWEAMARFKSLSVYLLGIALSLLGSGRGQADEAEESAWREARRLGTRNVFVEYLDRYPSGAYANRAADELFRLSWEGWNPDVDDLREAFLSETEDDIVPAALY